MAIDGSVDRIVRRTNLLDKLIRRQGIPRYGVFSVTTEGNRLPDASESASGYVIDAEGRVFFFWLDWDPQHGKPTFTEWTRVELESTWEEDEEYQEARRMAGLRE